MPKSYPHSKGRVYGKKGLINGVMHIIHKKSGEK